ncbi:MAG: hypothetical protein ACI8PZ_004832 [Myxococcota bacterium]|jgi:hypothetical protein
MHDAAALRDARLMLADLTSLLERRRGRWLAWGPTTPTIDAALIDDLRRILADVGIPSALVAAAEARGPGVPLPLAWSTFGKMQRRGVAAARELSATVDALLAETGQDGWRPLERSSPSRSRRRSHNPRQSYTANVAAG